MANNLFRLGLIMGDIDLLTKAKKMVINFINDFVRYPMGYSNWGSLMLKLEMPFFEVAILGADAELLFRKMQKDFYPHILWAFSSEPSNIPLLKDRFKTGKNLIYVCQNGICQLPVETILEAQKLVQ